MGGATLIALRSIEAFGVGWFLGSLMAGFLFVLLSACWNAGQTDL